MQQMYDKADCFIETIKNNPTHKQIVVLTMINNQLYNISRSLLKLTELLEEKNK